MTQPPKHPEFSFNIFIEDKNLQTLFSLPIHAKLLALHLHNAENVKNYPKKCTFYLQMHCNFIVVKPIKTKFFVFRSTKKISHVKVVFFHVLLIKFVFSNENSPINHSLWFHIVQYLKVQWKIFVCDVCEIKCVQHINISGRRKIIANTKKNREREFFRVENRKESKKCNCTSAPSIACLAGKLMRNLDGGREWDELQLK